MPRKRVMTIHARFFAMLAQKLSDRFADQYPQGLMAGAPVKLNLPEGSSVENLVVAVGIPKEYVSVVFVNGRAREVDFILKDRDHVGIFPPVGGG